MKQPYLTLACLAVLALAGCSSTSITQEAPTSASGGTKVVVTHVAIRQSYTVDKRNDDCYTTNGNVCHVVNITIDNRASSEDFSTNSLYWKVLDSKGGIYHIDSRTSGADEIAAGYQGTASYSIEAPPAVRLVKMQYDSFTAKLDVAIPPY